MGRTKAVIEVGGVAMADRVVAAMRSAGIDPVVLCGGDPVELDHLRAPLVADDHPGEGPLGGVLTALDHLAGVATHVAIAACDLATIDAGVLLVLRERVVDVRARVVVARGDRLEPMCAIWPVALADEVRALFDDGERAMHRAIAALDHDEVVVDPAAMANINDPGDLPG